MSSREVDRVATLLTSRIVRGTWAVGVRLPAETELAAELGCGRSTVREALGRLGSLGLVASRRGSGARVLDWRRDGTPALLPAYLAEGARPEDAGVLVPELLHIRSLLAREAVRLAARHALPEALGEAREALERAVGERDPAAHALAELEIFRALIVASGVLPAIWFANAFWGPMRNLHAALAPLAGPPPADFEAAMRALLALVGAKDEPGALAHLDAWLAGVDRVLRARFAGLGAPDAPAAPLPPQKKRAPAQRPARSARRTA